MVTRYRTSGVCCREIEFNIVDNNVTNVVFKSGCDGNLKGISRLIEGMNINEAIKRLKGISCSGKGTSCPDQLSKALQQFIDKNI